MVEETNYIDAIRARDIGLINVPKKAKNHAICLAAVNVNGLDIYHVPKYMRSEIICYSAIYQNAQAIKHLDPEYLSNKTDLIEMALSRQGQLFPWVLEHVPSAVSYTTCFKAVNASGSVLSHVPKEYMTKDLIIAAVLNDATALNLLFTSDVPGIKEAVNDVVYDIPLKFLPDHFKNYDVCKNQVEKQGRQLRYVPFTLIDDDLVAASLTSNPWAIEYVPLTFAHHPSVVEIIESKTVPEPLYKHIEAEPEFV